ncbi:MAG: bifunctional (p)ppGpp synthetase/guanosine-3',5'-bis(diphosphate) 3'-pyrophosphohydrolase [candidate division NC10 bacterium]|nr:bifunctional (p)ppGpp synthetase/guanosine-3',5'-bis(diphosphate) 3'-pyrophosphohydrolase [candidate division NC10 bacterium]
MVRLENILDKVQAYSPATDVTPIQRAYVFAAKAHRGQERRSGEPYLSHPLAVAEILADLHLDVSSIAAGLLHDAVEDTRATIEEIRDLFGDEVAGLVDGVTKISKLPLSTHQDRQAESFRKMLLAMSKDIRVILIKFADRLHNMRTLEPLPETKQRAVARETLDIYAPLAHRLGIARIKWELEDLALRYLDPEAYRDLQARVAKKRAEREGEINELIAILEGRLEEVGVQAQITGRPKHFYSIYKKMRNQGKEFDEIYDLVAVRATTDSVKDCYGALGIIHTLWKPIPGRFKDFIAVPKSNGYQSLHTTVIGPRGEAVEIQIRTGDMHTTAEEGIAAHWAYKEGKAHPDPGDKSFVWLRQLLDWGRDLKDPQEFMDTVRVDLFPDEVYVFTPKGDVKAFPRGATPIDFAFGIHTDIGLHCVGAKVNGRIVPLRYELQNGDIVEIVTSPQQHPSKDWLKIVHTPRARSRIRAWLKNAERARSVQLGRELLERELRKLGKGAAPLLTPEALAPVVERYGLGTAEEFLASVGYGKVSPRQAVGKLLPEEAEALVEAEAAKEREPRERRPVSKVVEEGIRIEGVDDILVRFGKCCTPLPGDEIVGFITRGRGVTIHTGDCPNVDGLTYDPARRIRVEWAERQRTPHQAKILVTIGQDRPGLLADISSAISSANVNIAQAEIRVTEERRGVNTFVLEVADLKQLQAAMQAVRKVSGVVGVERIRGS